MPHFDRPLSRTPIFLDCDTGIDDALAIAYLLTASHVEIVGIGAVSGNVNSITAARNTLDLIALFGAPDIPVAVGDQDFSDHRFDGGAPSVHGDNGIGNVVLPTSPLIPLGISAAELLVRLAKKHAGELRVIAIGPLTNLARALDLDPSIAKLIEHVTIMGGAVLAPGNVSAVAEANIANDPHAAAAVFDASWPITLVPLDVTMSQTLETHHLKELAASASPAIAALAQIIDFYSDFYLTRFGRRCAVLHDPLAAAIAIGSVTLANHVETTVEIDETSGPGRGQTIVDMRGMYGPAGLNLDPPLALRE